MKAKRLQKQRPGVADQRWTHFALLCGSSSGLAQGIEHCARGPVADQCAQVRWRANNPRY